MKKTRNKSKKLLYIILVPLLIGLLAVAGRLVKENLEIANAPDPHQTVEEFMALVCSGDIGAARELMPGMPELSMGSAPESPEAQALYGALTASRAYSLEGPASVSGREAEQRLRVEVLDVSKLAAGLNEEINAILAGFVEQAARAEEVYDEELNYKPEIVAQAFNQALSSRLENLRDYASEQSLTLKMHYSQGKWQLQNGAELAAALTGYSELEDAEALAEELRQSGTQELTYVKKRYTIDESALYGPAPAAERFGSTDDPAVIEALLERPEAKLLTEGQSLLWSADIERIPDTPIRYYLDETILVLVWQEVEAKAVGTFAEVIVADGSQLRRRIAGDQFQSFDFKTTSDFAAETNGVLTLGGDFYHHGRACGIVVYDRQILRFEPDSCDTCYISTGGDMLFSYRGQFQERAQAQQFIEENDVLFSLCFGPVLIDNGQDVTPEQYQWGEINDTYARSALGMLGERHYLTMNINCQQPGYYYLATLRQAADAMVKRGCIKAYTLDGGQTATTVFNGQLINPVQFGWEKPISDVIYFATALPDS